MADQVKFDDKAAREFFRDIKKNIDDVAKRRDAYVGSISIYVFRSIMEAFTKQIGPEGPWKDWSDAYAAHQAKRGRSQSKNMLKDSGNLRKQIIPIKSNGNYKLIPDGVMWFNNAQTKRGFPYAYAHNVGGEVLPKREFMWLTDKYADIISRVTAAYMLEGE